MMQKNWGYFSSIVKLFVLASLVGTILIGCTNNNTSRDRHSTENKSSSTIDSRGRNVRVENTQKIDIKGKDVRVSNSNSSTIEGVNTRSNSIGKNTEITQTDSSSTKIVNGRYLVGGTDQGLEVEGDRYHYDTEAGEQPWQNISDLEYVKNGVIFDGENYWCLSTLAPSPVTGCSANGWSR